MTSKEKKEYAALAVMLIATLLVVYFNFLKPKNPGPATLANSAGGTALPAFNGSAGPVSALPANVPGGSAGAGAAAGSAGSSAFLPSGTSIDLNVLDNPHFKALVPPVYPQVTPDEIGSNNLFGQGSSGAGQTAGAPAK